MNMTIAQRAALAEKERTDKYLKESWEAKREAPAWDGIDLLGLGGTGTGAVQSTGAGGFGFAANGSSSGSSTNRAADDDDWGLEDFVSAPTTQPQSASQSLLDLDEFTSAPSHPYKSANADFDFDFGDREDRLLPTASSGDEDDILGVLSKPVDSIQKRPSPVRLYLIN